MSLKEEYNVSVCSTNNGMKYFTFLNQTFSIQYGSFGKYRIHTIVSVPPAGKGYPFTFSKRSSKANGLSKGQIDSGYLIVDAATFRLVINSDVGFIRIPFSYIERYNIKRKTKEKLFRSNLLNRVVTGGNYCHIF